MAWHVQYLGVGLFREGETCVSLHSEVLWDLQEEPLRGRLEMTSAWAVLYIICDRLALWLEYWFPEGSNHFPFRFCLVQLTTESHLNSWNLG